MASIINRSVLFGLGKLTDPIGSLSVAETTSLAPEGEDFTYECWVYPLTSQLTYRTIMGLDNYSQTTGPFRLYQYGTSFYLYYENSSSAHIEHKNISIDTWYHLAISRSSGIIRFFVNGTQVGLMLTTLHLFHLVYLE